MSKKEQEVGNPRTIGGVKFDISQNDIISVLASDIMEEFETKMVALKISANNINNFIEKAKEDQCGNLLEEFSKLTGLRKKFKLVQVSKSNVNSKSFCLSFFNVDSGTYNRDKISLSSGYAYPESVYKFRLTYEHNGTTFRVESDLFEKKVTLDPEVYAGLVEEHKALVQEFKTIYEGRTMRETVILKEMKNKFTRDFIAKSTNKELKNLLTTTFKVK